MVFQHLPASMRKSFWKSREVSEILFVMIARLIVDKGAARWKHQKRESVSWKWIKLHKKEKTVLWMARGNMQRRGIHSIPAGRESWQLDASTDERDAIQRQSVQRKEGGKSGRPGEVPPKAGDGEDEDYSAKDTRKEQFPKPAESWNKGKQRSKVKISKVKGWLCVLKATGRPRRLKTLG